MNLQNLLTVKTKKVLRTYLPHPLWLGIKRWQYRKGFLSHHFDIIDKLDETSLVIDCGANIGVSVSLFVRAGAGRVVAFEPDPVAFERLKLTERLYFGLVEINKAAVGTEDKSARLYFGKKRQYDALAASYGSSLFIDNANVTEAFVDVKVVDLADVIEHYASVSLLKLDIEGSEVEVVPYLLSSGAIERIDVVVVETHERKSVDLKEKTIEMKDEVKKSKYADKFFFDWP